MNHKEWGVMYALLFGISIALFGVIDLPFKPFFAIPVIIGLGQYSYFLGEISVSFKG